MNEKKRIAAGAAAFAVLLISAFFVYHILSGEVDLPEILQPNSETDVGKTAAPDFTVVDTGGNEVNLSDFLGAPVVLNFWASWCPPCKAEMPDFDMVYGEAGENVIFMMVDIVDGRRETKEKGEKFITDMGFSFPVFYDINGSAANAYGITAIPTTVFIDKGGYIAGGLQGSIGEADLRRGLDMILLSEEL